MIKVNELTKDYYRLGEVAKYIGVTARTVYNYTENGLMPYELMGSGDKPQRIVKKKDLIDYLKNKDMIEDDTRRDVIYVRVATHKEVSESVLQGRIDAVTNYANNHNPQNIMTITEVGSPSNDKRVNLNKLLDMVLSGKVNRIYCYYKDCLARDGYRYIEKMCKHFDTEIISVYEEMKKADADSVGKDVADANGDNSNDD